MNEISAKTSHTQEPWHVKRGSEIYSHALPIAEASRNYDNEIGEANARRIVACVNVCAGIPTEDLERYPKELGGGMKAMWNVERQRDELLAALERIASGEAENGCIMSAGECSHIAYEALSKVKGGA